VIRFDGVVLRYPRAAEPAVRGVSLEARRGALTAVVGPNGSGKSTLVRALLGRLRAERGAITLDGAPLGAFSRREVARRVAIVPQREEPAFPLVVRDFIALGRFAHEMGVFELLDALAREGRAVLLVSHQLNLVARFATTIALLHRGALAASGPPDAVMRGDELERVYEWPLVVSRDPAVGAPVLVPLRHRAPK